MPPRKRRPAPAIADLELSGSSDDEGGRPAKAARGGSGGTAGAGRLVSTYFQAQKDVGSSRTLADLQLGAAEGEEESLREYLATLPERNVAAKEAARQRHEAQFGRWWAHLRAGNSLLLYGFGSKYDLLEKFAHEWTKDGQCVKINCLQPGVTAKQVMQIAVAVLKGDRKPHLYRSCTKDELLQLVRSDERRIYVIIHNIDGPGLRERAAQQQLSELAALPNCHLVASVDHANAALLWDQQTRDRFSWLWFNVTNFAPYIREVGYAAIPSLLVGRGEQCSKQSATVVLASLSHSAREVFRLIAETQIDNPGEHGITFARLFQRCRERFLVSNDMLLRSFLTEFRDHELLQTKRGQDGSDLLLVPLGEDALRQVLEVVDAMG
jgi:origin recognition complex subunit 2